MVGHLIGASCGGLGEICDRKLWVLLDNSWCARKSRFFDFGKYFVTIGRECGWVQLVEIGFDSRFLLFAGFALFGNGRLGDRRCLLWPNSAAVTTTTSGEM